MEKEIQIPGGFEAKIEGNKVIFVPKVSKDERIRNRIICYLKQDIKEYSEREERINEMLAYLEKQKEPDKAQFAVDLIDKYIDEHTANAHEMKDSNPDKKYYSGVDDTLSDIAGILTIAYSEEKQKEQKPVENIVYPHYLALDEAIRLYYYTYGNGKGGFDYISLPKFQDIVEEFVKNYGQKPAEWSEGIKKTLDEISDYLKYKGREEDADFIRNLRPQPHWKPSKEQIKAIDLALSFVTDDFDEHPTLSETLREFYNELLKNYSYE